ncbi:Abi-alpha family protein [Polyangium spumosum]|uniref:DUF4393 domain-containing protein n=1 Tax=Polyangium spumosum TaxID=889282 RepID=A0A6N7Q2R2_9BACT|nr:Abi-alpha family protein [Polyangium spumosum]MRG98638.1 DUF4393 domain-containing protein [Polyangium spumosum]
MALVDPPRASTRNERESGTDRRSSTGDLLGLAPYGEAVKLGVDRATSGIGQLLTWICKPAAEEIGLLFRDKIRAWRAVNAEKIAKETLRLLLERGDDPAKLAAPPQLVHAILDSGSWTEDELLQRLWAGLLASACNVEGNDNRSQKFVDHLKRLSPAQAKILKFACEMGPKKLTSAGLLYTEDFVVSIECLKTLTALRELEDIDAELDHLRHLGLLMENGGGIPLHSDATNANIAPSALGLYLFARCSGVASARDFYKDVTANPPENS